MLLWLLACAGPLPTTGVAWVEDGEWLPGGDTTNTLLGGSNAFIMPAATLSPEEEALFYSGNSFFNQAWVEAPSSTDARDGLGPVFNARACSSCHFKDGRAPAPSNDVPLGALVRLGVPGPDGVSVPEPVYGGQLQDQANPGVPVEGRIDIAWEELSGAYDDGTPYRLRRPILGVSDLGYGPMDPDVQLSLRVAPHVIGLGLLEAIPESRLAELEDPDDHDGDGISGRRNVAWDPELDAPATGRFGWKAEQATVMAQSAGAFAGDMGITSALAPDDDCTDSQSECLDQPSGAPDPDGVDEAEAHVLDRVGLYAATVAPPVRVDWDDPTVLRGKWLFSDAGCADCHVPHHQTGVGVVEGLDEQLIWPYTDLLLHDMGEGLSDGRPVRSADGAEWRTPPLWGLGRVPEVNGHDELLHDGRARGFAEAILWHGGEGEDSMLAFKAMPADDREALVAFLETL